MSSISDSITAHIKYLTDKKNYLNGASTDAEKNEHLAYTRYNSDTANWREIEYILNALTNQYKKIMRAKESALNEARKNGASPSEIASIERGYNDDLAVLGAQIETYKNESYFKYKKMNKSGEEYSKYYAERDRLTTDIKSTCQDLMDEYLTDGRFKQQEVVNNYTTKPIDYMG